MNGKHWQRGQTVCAVGHSPPACALRDQGLYPAPTITENKISGLKIKAIIKK